MLMLQYCACVPGNIVLKTWWREPQSIILITLLRSVPAAHQVLFVKELGCHSNFLFYDHDLTPIRSSDRTYFPDNINVRV